jgi:hypothetical protein
MNKLMSKLPLLAFVLAAFAAVAFTSPKEVSDPMYGFDGTHWYLIQGDEGVTYVCDSDNTPGCLFDAIEGQPIDPEVERKFVNISLVPVGNLPK